MKIKILIAEDHEFTRQGLTFGLNKYENLEVVDEAGNGRQAVELAIKHKPDLILMDISMPVLSGIEASKQIKAIGPDMKILILTSHKEREKVLSAFSSGADGYCVKDIKLEELVNIIEMVNKGSIHIDSSIAGYVLEILQAQKVLAEEKKQKVDFNLTKREKEILKLMAEGLSNKDISDKLFLSLYTVKNHVSNIIQKLSVDDRTQAAVKALTENLI